MGQFESDFTSMNGRTDVQYASESIFLMKKMYMNQLLLTDGTIDYMYRGKGLTQKCILMKAKKFVDENDSIGLLNLFKHLFSGETVEFNLCDGAPRFKKDKDMTISTLKQFKRKIKTEYEIGE